MSGIASTEFVPANGVGAIADDSGLESPEAIRTYLATLTVKSLGDVSKLKTLDFGSIAGCAALQYSQNLKNQKLQNDIENTLLYAQLTMDPSISFADHDSWYITWRKTLQSVGWKIKGFTLAEIAPGYKNDNVNETLKNLGKDELSAGDLKALENLLAALGKGKNQGARDVFNHDSIDKKNSLFQILLVSPSTSEGMSFVTGMHVAYAAKNVVTDSLNTSIESKEMLYIKSAIVMDMTFDKKNYDPSRDKVEKAIVCDMDHIVSVLE